MELNPALLHFGTLPETAFRLLDPAGFHPVELAEDHRARSGLAGCHLHSHQWDHASGASMRCAEIASPRSEIINMMIFPRPGSPAPVFACEYILLGSKPTVAVLDLQDPIGKSTPLAERISGELDVLLADLRPRLTDGGALPEWALSHFTAGCLYVRPASLEELPLLGEAFERVLHRWVGRFFAESLAQPDAPACRDALQHYKEHHIQNTPGRPFLRKLFGENWAEHYLSGFMYR